MFIQRFILTISIAFMSVSIDAHNTDVVHEDCNSFVSWASDKNIIYLHEMENLRSESPSFRIGNKLMNQLATKNGLAKTDTYDWDVYVPCIQKEIDDGITISFSNIKTVPEEYIEQNYPGLEYVSCNVNITGSVNAELRDLFILKDNKIVKIADYIETIDDITGKRKIELDYLELARAAFADGNYQRCYDLYKEGGLKIVREREKKGWSISDVTIFPYIESCIALNDWNGAMYGFTRMMNRKYWVNGREWKLDPIDIQTWNKAKSPLMEVLLRKIYQYYASNFNAFIKSPIVKHIQLKTNRTIEDYKNLAAQYFWKNKNIYVDRVFALKASAEYGNVNAQRQIGKIYLEGHNLNKKELNSFEVMIPCDTVKAIYWFDKASLNGDAEAAKIAAHFQLSGFGIERDYNKAFNNYIHRELDLDYDIQYGLGLCYYYGLGTSQDFEKALIYLMSSEDWHPEIPYLIGNIYYASSNPNAIKYYNKALQRKGTNESVRHEILTILSECNRFGRCGLPINEDEANRLLREWQQYIKKDSNNIKDYLISLTKINFSNEPL